MIALIQRVIKGSVTKNNEMIAKISKGYVILLGIYEDDSEEDITKIVNKILNIRIMSDAQDKLNLSIKDIQGEILLVSQFTLCADLTYGRRPSFIKAMHPDKARTMYESIIEKLRLENIYVQTGSFGNYMEVEIVNDGPVTIIVDSKKS
jgi:D-tyrosyl-tRNA(Tyr) deacylase